ncbi:hypothetical protein CUR86_16145 [Salinicola acroporae]|uniref:Uncharacterized protein n=1 Tax=Salinicola acroporae TaxID=1541440 RepID=A0ABT6I9M9_9GAMM|nr:hypothetical protein [Salinicola acroporae]
MNALSDRPHQMVDEILRGNHEGRVSPQWRLLPGRQARAQRRRVSTILHDLSKELAWGFAMGIEPGIAGQAQVRIGHDDMMVGQPRAIADDRPLNAGRTALRMTGVK